MDNELRQVLEGVREGRLTVDEAAVWLRSEPFRDIGYAKVDLHRKTRQGAAEVIYGAGKTPEQIVGIADVMSERGQGPILITRLEEAAAETVGQAHPLDYHRDARVGIIGQLPPPGGLGTVVVATGGVSYPLTGSTGDGYRLARQATGGTSDIPVAEEAALTAQALGNRVERLYDVGVAGLHRTLAHLDEIMGASVIIAIAGMEGALASVIGGLADCPVIAVPTSVGYGASFGGLSALLSMLNSCASGVSVVNIDNGFGAGYLADRINHMNVKKEA